MCTGSCEWESLGGTSWDKLTDTCPSGCGCFEPTHVGMIGDRYTTDCNSDAPQDGGSVG